MMHALVVCIGNDLVADDGVGACVFRALQRHPLPNTVRLRHLGAAGIDLIDLFEADDLFLLVDAANLGDVPGTVRVRLPRATQTKRAAVSAHDIGVLDALAIGSILKPGRLPRCSAHVTVEGACFNELRMTLSPAVQAAIPRATSTVLRLLTSRGVQR